MLTICTWLWGNAKYTPIYVERLYEGVRRHLAQPFRFLLMTERERSIELSVGIERCDIEDSEWTIRPGCFARLRMFDPEWQRRQKINGPVVCLDLDLVITGPLDSLFNRDESIVVLEGANSVNPCPFNNSVFMFQSGMHSELWSDFSMDAVRQMKYFEFPDDQGWFWHKLPRAATWKVGPSSGIYSFRKRGWSPGDVLPAGARIVAFPGHRDPAQFTHLPWIKEFWK
jgi:hypothetical protein